MSTTLRSSKQTESDNAFLIHFEILRESLPDEKFILNYIYFWKGRLCVLTEDALNPPLVPHHVSGFPVHSTQSESACTGTADEPTRRKHTKKLPTAFKDRDEDQDTNREKLNS